MHNPVSFTLSYCHLTIVEVIEFVDSYFRYEALIPGDTELAAKYKGRLYLFVSEAKREKFMRYA